MAVLPPPAPDGDRDVQIRTAKGKRSWPAPRHPSSSSTACSRHWSSVN